MVLHKVTCTLSKTATPLAKPKSTAVVTTIWPLETSSKETKILANSVMIFTIVMEKLRETQNVKKNFLTPIIKSSAQVSRHKPVIPLQPDIISVEIRIPIETMFIEDVQHLKYQLTMPAPAGLKTVVTEVGQKSLILEKILNIFRCLS